MTRNRNLSFGRVSTPSGIFRATVTKVNVDTISVRIPNLTGPNVYNDVPFYGDKPSVNDEIIVGFLNGNSATPVAMILTGEASTLTGGGGSSVGGANTQVQYNNSGVLAGSANMTFDGTSLNVAGLKLASTAITSTAAELNILDGVTSNAAELNLLDGITAGTVSASLAVIVDSDKDITGFRNVTLTGELDAATLDISGDADIDGTTNLDVVDIDGAVDMASTLTVADDLNVDSGAFFVDASANSVGINTASPQVALHVSSTGTEAVRIQRSPTDQVGAYIGMYDDDERLGYIGYAGNDDLYLENEATAGKTFLSTGGSIRLAIDADGKVGIGTTSPVGHLSVDSQNRQISIIDSGTVNYAEIRAHAVDNATGYANVNYNAYSHNFVIEGTRKLYIDNNGDILPETDSTIDLGNSSRYFANAYIDSVSAGNATITNSTGNYVLIGGNANEQIKLVSDNNSGRPYISFWNQDASGNLDRKGYIGYPHANNNTSTLYVRCDQGTLDLGAKILLPSTASYVLWPATLPTVTSYSTLRRGTYSGTGNVVGYDGSSIRYKENVTNFVKSDWEKIYNLQAVRFTWKEEVAADKHASWGLISEDVYAEIPELGVMRVVEGVNDGNPVPDTVNYEQMCVFLLEAVKDLNARLAAVE